VSVPCSSRTLRNKLLATAAGFWVPGGGVDPAESLVEGGAVQTAYSRPNIQHGIFKQAASDCRVAHQ
jgi:hypothetical protein